MTAVGVMLVDDHAVVREGYRRLLQAEPGLQVLAEHGDAESAQATLERQALGLLAAPVQVAVVDLGLPGRGGLELTRRIAQRWPAVRVLVFSMHDHPATVAQALDAGAAGYVTKTSAPQLLVAAVRRVAAGERGVLSPDVAQHASAPSAQAPHMRLSPREYDVLQGLLAGTTLEAIAQRLCISPKTVSNLQTQIRTKLGVATAMELLHYAQQHGLVAGGTRR
jgi:DNA-binding NarL/FixJ family response regulator